MPPYFWVVVFVGGNRICALIPQGSKSLDIENFSEKKDVEKTLQTMFSENMKKAKRSDGEEERETWSPTSQDSNRLTHHFPRPLIEHFHLFTTWEKTNHHYWFSSHFFHALTLLQCLSMKSGLKNKNHEKRDLLEICKFGGIRCR